MGEIHKKKGHINCFAFAIIATMLGEQLTLLFWSLRKEHRQFIKAMMNWIKGWDKVEISQFNCHTIVQGSKMQAVCIKPVGDL